MYPEKNKQRILEDCVRETQLFSLDNKRKALYKDILEMVERPLIEITLQKTDGNQKKAAKLLGINRNTLHAKIKKLNIDISKFKFYY
ncbi:MAG: Fis family transcriptional regulator [Candidatus Omnitrophica bacterium]|nr:Fis family transcriptional regulator [Candidatus Omnitrophota bacterium]